MSVIDGIAVLLLIAPVVDWTAAVILAVAATRYPAIVTLRERAVVAVVLALAASSAAVLAANRLHLLTIHGDAAIGLLAVALVLLSLPAVYWLGLLLTGRLRFR